VPTFVTLICNSVATRLCDALFRAECMHHETLSLLGTGCVCHTTSCGNTYKTVCGGWYHWLRIPCRSHQVLVMAKAWVAHDHDGVVCWGIRPGVYEYVHVPIYRSAGGMPCYILWIPDVYTYVYMYTFTLLQLQYLIHICIMHAHPRECKTS
jgi:hypothetical protein